MLHRRQAPGRDFHKHFSLAPARSDTNPQATRNPPLLPVAPYKTGLKLAMRCREHQTCHSSPSRTQAPHSTCTCRKPFYMPTSDLTNEYDETRDAGPRRTTETETCDIPLSSDAQLRVPPRLPRLFGFLLVASSSDEKWRKPPERLRRRAAASRSTEDRGSISAPLAPAIDSEVQPGRLSIEPHVEPPGAAMPGAQERPRTGESNNSRATRATPHLCFTKHETRATPLPHQQLTHIHRDTAPLLSTKLYTHPPNGLVSSSRIFELAVSI